MSTVRAGRRASKASKQLAPVQSIAPSTSRSIDRASPVLAFARSRPIVLASSRSTALATALASLALAFGSCSGCASSPGDAVKSASPAPALWSYDVAVSADAHELRIEADYAARAARKLSVHTGAEPFVHEVELAAGDGWKRIEPDDGYWILPEDGATHRLRYRFLLRDAAHALGDPDTASYSGDVLVAPPSTWLLHPFDSREGDVFRLHVSAGANASYACGLTPDPSAPDTFGGAAEDLSESPYCAFGPITLHRVEARGGAEVLLALAPGSYQVTEAEIVSWVERSALAVGSYYGVFPMHHACVIVTEGRGRSVEGGKTLGNSGASILVSIGRRATQRALDEDWILTHEMIHLALPSVPRQHHWLEEGSATYLEPIARARAGQRTPEQVWRDLVQGLPQGLPRANDHGLDHTPTWGRTYWGGALYWLLADIEIRKRTDNRRGLEDALRGVIDAGGTIADSWDVERVLKTADQAVGVPVLTELYTAMANDPHPVDLPALWKELGVVAEGRKITFDDSAPLAAIRMAITRTPETK